MSPTSISWMAIPQGHVTLWEYVEIPKEQATSAGLKPYGTFDLPAFQISQHPITNAQFAPFIEAGGYHRAQYWTAEGWQFKANGHWVEPRFWQAVEWNRPDYPVIGISWYEALAFCQWLKTSVGDPVTLPSEAQWHRAAQGDDGRDCPWGSWDEDEVRCNVSIVQPWGQHRTSSVHQYEGIGDSPFNVADMLGNVAEWTLTPYQPPHDDATPIRWRITCGSWNPYWYGHLNSRSGSRQDYRQSDCGFRVCRLATPKQNARV